MHSQNRSLIISLLQSDKSEKGVIVIQQTPNDSSAFRLGYHGRVEEKCGAGVEKGGWRCGGGGLEKVQYHSSEILQISGKSLKSSLLLSLVLFLALLICARVLLPPSSSSCTRSLGLCAH